MSWTWGDKYSVGSASAARLGISEGTVRRGKSADGCSTRWTVHAGNGASKEADKDRGSQRWTRIPYREPDRSATEAAMEIHGVETFAAKPGRDGETDGPGGDFKDGQP